MAETDRGERDVPNYHLGAILTLRDFTRVMIETALYVNNERRRDDVILPIQDKTSRGTWNSRKPDETLRSMPKGELLPKGEAAITKYGVRFKGAFYHNEYLFEKDDMSQIYYCDNGRYEARLLTSRMRQYEADLTIPSRVAPEKSTALTASIIWCRWLRWRTFRLNAFCQTFCNFEEILKYAEHFVTAIFKIRHC